MGDRSSSHDNIASAIGASRLLICVLKHFQLQYWRRKSDILEPPSGGFPGGLLDRAFDARFRAHQNPKARFNGLMSEALAVMLELFNSKHAGSALMIRLLR